MTEIAEQRRRMLLHLKELNKLSLKANIKHSENVRKNLDHTIQMTKFMKEDRAKIDRLNNVIDMKQREIDEINKTNTDLLWKLAVLEKKNGKLQEYRDNNEAQIAYYEKKLNKFKFDIDNEKDN